MKKDAGTTAKTARVTVELTPDVACRYVMAIAQLRTVKGLLQADNVSRFSGGDSPLDDDEALIAAVHLMREGIDALTGLRLHEHMLELHPNAAALSVEE